MKQTRPVGRDQGLLRSVRELLDAQHAHWEHVFTTQPGKFGTAPSEAAGLAHATFSEHRCRTVLELGCGAGRDALFFASQGYAVTALDYAGAGIAALRERARETGIGANILALVADVRRPLPFRDATFDAVYAHMLHCMALRSEQVSALLRETLRVLRPGGVHAFTVRSRNDPDYGTGTPLGDDTFDVDGDVIHFFGHAAVERLAAGYEVLNVRMLEEGSLPKRLYHVTLRK